MHPMMTEALVHQYQAERRWLAEQHRLGRPAASSSAPPGPPARTLGDAAASGVCRAPGLTPARPLPHDGTIPTPESATGGKPIAEIVVGDLTAEQPASMRQVLDGMLVNVPAATLPSSRPPRSTSASGQRDPPFAPDRT